MEEGKIGGGRVGSGSVREAVSFWGGCVDDSLFDCGGFERKEREFAQCERHLTQLKEGAQILTTEAAEMDMRRLPGGTVLGMCAPPLAPSWVAA